MPSLDLICLANSYKWSYRCLAGLRVDGGGWVRPVSDKEHGALQYSQYRLPDDSEPHLFDVIRVGLSHPHPAPYQPENWLVNNSAWTLLERPASADHVQVVTAAVFRGSLLFGNAGRSVPVAQFRSRAARESLALVQPTDIRWRTEFSMYQLRNVARVLFRLGDVPYDLPLTDPAYAGPLLRRAEGDYRSPDLGIPEDATVLLTISLGEPLDGLCYKLVAAVLVV
ncbi:MAG: hypothetical protein ABSH32_29915 [Bryobacteraceae bacterium]|jgi:hypothetical protein